MPRNSHYSIERLMEVYGDLCHWCKTPVTIFPAGFPPKGGKARATREHLKPYVLGGCGCLANMRVSCPPCNNNRGHKWDGVNYCEWHADREPRNKHIDMGPIIWKQMYHSYHCTFDFYTEAE